MQPFLSQNRWQPCEAFFASLSQARTQAATPVLALDYDGTLAPFHIDRSQALPYPGVQRCLSRIQAETPTHLVLISGRSAGEVRSLLALDPAPEIWGAHGMQRLHPDGRQDTIEPSQREQELLQQALAELSRLGLSHLAEGKHGSVAVHWRGLSPEESCAIEASVRAAWQPMATRLGAPLLEFDGGIELRVPQQNKGEAIRTILGELPPQTPIAYLGDDLTDEDAFLALLGHSPSLPVLVRPEWRTTHARAWIRSPEELLGFLEAWLHRSQS